MTLSDKYRHDCYHASIMTKNHAIGLVMLILISGLTGCKSQFLQTSPQSISVSGKNIIPLDFHRDVPIVSVKINGKGPYRLVLDSATAVTFLYPQVVEELTLPDSIYEGKQTVATDGHYKAVPYKRIERLQIGGVTIRNMDIAQRTLCETFFDKDEKIHGVLGIRTFLHALCTIDYPNKQLIVRPYKALKRDSPNVVQTELQRSLIQKMDLYVVDRRLPCSIDTSSPYDVMFFNFTGVGLPFISNDPIVSEPYITPYYDNTDDESVRLVPSQLDAAFYLGGTRILQPTIHNLIYSDVSSATRRQIEALVRTRYGIIGGGLLKHFALTFDLRNSRIRFERSEDTPIQINPTPNPSDSPEEEVDDSVAAIELHKSTG